MDICKDIEITKERDRALKLSPEVRLMAEKSPELLNDVYRDISDALGMDIALEIYCLFKGQQICFPIRFFNPEMIHKKIIAEYDGTNIRQLAI